MRVQLFTLTINKDITMPYPKRNKNKVPQEIFEGMRAVNTQNYTESNIKLGVQYEISRILTNVPSLSSVYSVFITGNLPVSLKGRVFSYSGDGIVASIYKDSVYTGGINEQIMNANDINPVTSLSQVLSNVNVTDIGSLAFAQNHYIGNKSNQGKGGSSLIQGNEKILKPNTAYLLVIESLDSAAQDISALLSWYEGELDLPLK